MVDALVSVLTPSFNQAPWLVQCLESVRNQTYPHIEHIVMDGGSTDDTVSLLRMQRDPRVKWWSEPDNGQSDALLKALARSSGQIIAWINSDDSFADRRAIERVVETFRARPDADVVYGSVLDITTDSRMIRVNYAPPAWIKSLHPKVFPVTQPGGFFRRAAIEDNFVKPDLHYSMDRELFIRLQDQGKSFVRLTDVLSTNRWQPNRKSMQTSDVIVAENQLLQAGNWWNHYTEKITSIMVSQLWRTFGVVSCARINQTLDPALDIHVPSLIERIKLQMFVRLQPYVSSRS